MKDKIDTEEGLEDKYYRPLYMIPKPVWDNYVRKNRPMRAAWNDVKGYAKLRDRRAAVFWMFAFGWAMCERHYRKMLPKLDTIALKHAEYMGNEASRYFATLTKINLLDM